MDGKSCGAITFWESIRDSTHQRKYGAGTCCKNLGVGVARVPWCLVNSWAVGPVADAVYMSLLQILSSSGYFQENQKI